MFISPYPQSEKELSWVGREEEGGWGRGWLGGSRKIEKFLFLEFGIHAPRTEPLMFGSVVLLHLHFITQAIVANVFRYHLLLISDLYEKNKLIWKIYTGLKKSEPKFKLNHIIFRLHLKSVYLSKVSSNNYACQI